ncbi:DEBR0S2_16864g1_1 [Brettanomyces bruxellensis]|uniref:DEBR0S2_16864g1_1 n=2 Tax=Dekkera bruxellensis TaxID=5007 RepID=A0A7D9CX24_DEKBR|nr:DEBR0S2_16864g1_1 [Brettanomyces bruxellensis]
MKDSPLAPTLRPSEAQFADPIGFMSSDEVISLGEKYGIIKIVPPEGWKPKFALDKDKFTFHTRLQNLWELGLIGRSRNFFLEGFNNYLRSKGKKPMKSSKNRSRGRRKKHANKQKDKKSQEYDGFLGLKNGSKIHIHTLYIEGNFTHYANLVNDPKLLRDVEKYSNLLKIQLEDYSKLKTGRRHNTLSRLLTSEADDKILNLNKGCSICHKNNHFDKMLLCNGCEKGFHMYCLNPALRVVPKNDWYCDECLRGTNGDYGFEEDYSNIFTLTDFEEYCEEEKKNFCETQLHGEMNPSIDQLEAEFWKLVDGGSNGTYEADREQISVRYGADIHKDDAEEVSGFPTEGNSLIDQEAGRKYIDSPFNLTRLPFAGGSLLRYFQKEDRNQMSGITIPWLYVGSMFSTFCWHKEDHYTLSANYCHMGSTKKWYAIPARDCQKFEALCKSIAPDYFKKQPGLLHQMTTLISPHDIASFQQYRNIKLESDDFVHCYSVNQEANEFVITFPMVYHAGFNCGFNVNEAVNFTMPYWLGYGEQAVCDYIKDGKEDVFNYYGLLRNIMDILMNDKEEYKNIEDEFGQWTVTAMLDHCFLSYSEQVRQFGLLKNDKKLQSILAQIPHTDFEEYQQERQRKLLAGCTHHRTGRKLSVQKEQEDNTYDPDEFICHECKAFVNYQWIEVDILKKIAADLQDISNTNGQKQLPTPGNSPPKFGSNNKGEDIESEWKQIMEKAREEGLNESIKNNESHAGMRLRKRRKIVRNDNSDTYELSSDYAKQRKEKMLNRMKNKRRKHYNFGKMVFCLNCFTRGISKMDPTQIEQLKKISVVYDRESYEHLREHIEKTLEPKLGLLGIKTHH